MDIAVVWNENIEFKLDYATFLYPARDLSLSI